MAPNPLASLRAHKAIDHHSSTQRSHQLSKPTSPNMHILLTGSTGNMGAYILHSLLTHPEITHITCLNRSPSASTRQLQNHELRGLDESASLLRSNSPRISFLTVDFTSPTLNLSPTQYASLTPSATHIIHNAWPVSFNLAFSSFLPSLQGLQNLITLALHCHHQCTFTFISSISVVGRWGSLPGSTSTVPETVLKDWRTAKMGYGQSKLVAERICATASEECGLRSVIVRVGQVAGPVERGEKGSWNKWEWLPSLIASSSYLGVIPETLGPMEDVDWVPVDVLGRAIGELVVNTGNEEGDGSKSQRQRPEAASRMEEFLGALKSKKTKPNTALNGFVTIYHTSNPHLTSFSHVLLPIITHHLESHTNKSLKTISFTAWVDALENSTNQNPNSQSQSSDAAAEHNPATKLLTFFKELQDKATRFPDARSAVLETRETGKVSPSLRECESVGEEWMGLWMRQWGY